MRVLHIAASDTAGGASRAAMRLYQCLATASGVESKMLVSRRFSNDPHVLTLERSRIGQLVLPSLRRGFNLERYIGGTGSGSTARVPTAALKRIHEIAPDIVVLHWLGNEVMSIRQVGRLLASEKPVAWLLHDTWPFCGAEHYPIGDEDVRFIEGYSADNRTPGERGLDLNRTTWSRKQRYWNNSAQLVASSQWMARMATRSRLMRDWPLRVIPIPLDTDWWGAVSRTEARRRLGISDEEKVVLFGAQGGLSNKRKGGDLFLGAIPRLVDRMERQGQARPIFFAFGGPVGVERIHGVEVRSVGPQNDCGLRNLYSAADVMVVPSRSEAFGQTASEAISCGTPVVAFAIGGLTDIVQDGVTGRLVEPFLPEKLADGIVDVISDRDRAMKMSEAANRSARRWSTAAVRESYLALFGEMTSRSA